MADRDGFDTNNSCTYNITEECKGRSCNQCGKFSTEEDKAYWEWKMSQ